jgi:CubicO group peptidase (beta-lactamase class C family)
MCIPPLTKGDGSDFNRNALRRYTFVTMSLRRILAVMTLIALVLPISSADAEEVIKKADLDAMIAPLVEGGWVDALVIGVVDERGRQVLGYGHLPGGAAPDGQTVFELGSVTKTFTALLLQQMAQANEVSLADPVQKYLPQGVTVPQRSGQEIRLIDLVTHTSGLPRMPNNFRPTDLANPYADYGVDRLYAFLSGHTLQRDIGAQVEYSNLGFGLLGHALSRKAGTSYEDLVVSRICKPLGMESTKVTLDDSMTARLPPGHDADGQAMKNWDLPTFAGAGALRTTADDMLKYLAAQAGLTPTPLAEAMTATQRPRKPIGPMMDVAMAWHVMKPERFVWHNGQTGGYHTFVGFSPQQKVGVVVLANQTCRYLDAVGFRLLRIQTGKTPPPLTVPRLAKVDAAALDACAATYNFGGIGFNTIKREGDHLTGQLVGQPPVKFYPESAERYFARVVDAVIEFDKDATGTVTQLSLHQNGVIQTAARVTGATPATTRATTSPSR